MSGRGRGAGFGVGVKGLSILTEAKQYGASGTYNFIIYSF